MPAFMREEPVRVRTVFPGLEPLGVDDDDALRRAADGLPRHSAAQAIGGEALRLRMVGQLAADRLLEAAGHEHPYGTGIRNEEGDSPLDSVMSLGRHRGSLKFDPQLPSGGRGAPFDSTALPGPLGYVPGCAPAALALLGSGRPRLRP